MTDKYLKRYIKKFISDIKIHNKEYFLLIDQKFNKYNELYLEDTILKVIDELSFFGQITRKNLYPFCSCILYGILNNSITFFSMNSSALIPNSNKLREKPQYVQINHIENRLKEISHKINIKINYISILPDYSFDFPLDVYEECWEKNRKYLEQKSKKEAYRLSQLYKKDINSIKTKIINRIDFSYLNNLIRYYENNNFIVLGFFANPDFQRRQILSYLATGLILEEIMPFAILIDVQKRYYPFEQKFYNYARKYKLPIILCGQGDLASK